MPYVRFRLERGILYCTYRDDLYMDLEVAKLCLKERLDFSKGISYPCLIDIKGLKAVDGEARAYMAKEGGQLMKAGALITDSMYTKMLGNIFFVVNKPKVPGKLFSNEAAALKWLKQYL